jgi:hypothetical protein
MRRGVGVGFTACDTPNERIARGQRREQRLCGERLTMARGAS